MDERTAEQEGVVSRAQLIASGLSRDQARALVRNKRWHLIHPGVYATFTGPLSDRARIWAAVLHAGPGAVASHATALWLLGAGDQRTGLNPIEVAVPADRKVVAPSGIRVHRRRSLERLVHPAASPPRTRLEVALLDVTDRTDIPEVVVGVVLGAIQKHLTTAARVRDELAVRPRHRWRSLIADLLVDAEAGAASPLERRYLRDVERAHGLPAGERNRAERTPAGGTRYRDVRYRPWRLVVELDGRAAHPDDEAFRDWQRDNALVVAGEHSLRYGWADVTARPCQIAVQVTQVLITLGWGGQPAPCSTGCPVNSRGRGRSTTSAVADLPRSRQPFGARTAAS